MMANSKDQKTNILKDLVTKNAHVQYEKSDIYHFEIMTNAIFFKEIKCVKVNRKIWLQGLFMWNMKTFALTVDNSLLG